MSGRTTLNSTSARGEVDHSLTHGVVNAKDRLEYMSDLLLELHQLAEGLGLKSLALILVAASEEANVQRRVFGK